MNDWPLQATVKEMIDEGYTDTQIVVELDIDINTLLDAKRKILEGEKKQRR